MYVMNMFCPIKANKNRKSHPPSRNNGNNDAPGTTIQSQSQQNQNANNATNQANNNININNQANNNNGNSNNNNSGNANGNNHNIENRLPAGPIPQYRYVTKPFTAYMKDELSVLPGDVVLLEFTDTSSDERSWSHVLSLKTNERGFVPTDFLSIDPTKNPQCKKKLPRSMAEVPLDSLHSHPGLHPLPPHHHHHHLSSHGPRTQDHHQLNVPLPMHQHANLHAHMASSVHDHHPQHHPHHQQQYKLNQLSATMTQDSIHKSHHNLLMDGDQPSSNGDTANNMLRFQIPSHHMPANVVKVSQMNSMTRGQSRPNLFDIAHSNQGSSGKQSFQKYPDLTSHLTSPAYYNLKSNDPHYEHFGLKCTPFHREDFGVYIVTNNFVAREENDLSVKSGEYVTVLNKEDEDWYWIRRNYDRAEGFVPSKFIVDYKEVSSIINKGNSTITMKSSNQNDFHTYMNQPDRESLPGDQQSSVFQH